MRRFATAALAGCLLACLAIAGEKAAAQPTAAPPTDSEYCTEVLTQIRDEHGRVGLNELLRSAGDAISHLDSLEREIEALEGEWQKARYEHEADTIADRMAYPQALWNAYRRKLDCIFNLLEKDLIARPPPGGSPSASPIGGAASGASGSSGATGGDAAAEAEKVKRRKQQADQFGAKYQPRFDEVKRRSVPGTPTDTGINVVGGLGVGYRFGPDIEIGRNGGNSGPYHKGDADIMFTQGSFDVSIPAFGGPDAPGGVRFGLKLLGEIGDHLQKFGDSNDAGFITIIDGSNPALTPIVASQDARVKSQWWSIAATPYLEWRRSIGDGAWLELRFGPHYEHQDYSYAFREMVSGGGPFFSHRLDYDFEIDRYGALFGIGIEQRLGSGFGWRAEGSVVPSWRDVELRGRQSGTALGSAKVRDTDDGFGLTAGLNAGLWVRLSPGIRFDATVGGAYRSDAPRVRYPTAGGMRLRSRTDTAFEAVGHAQITIRLSDLPINRLP